MLLTVYLCHEEYARSIVRLAKTLVPSAGKSDKSKDTEEDTNCDQERQEVTSFSVIPFQLFQHTPKNWYSKRTSVNWNGILNL